MDLSILVEVDLFLTGGGNSEIPMDARVCCYAAESDGKTLVPHLERFVIDLPEVIDPLLYILADDAYKENRKAVRRFGQQARLIVVAAHDFLQWNAQIALQ